MPIFGRFSCFGSSVFKIQSAITPSILGVRISYLDSRELSTIPLWQKELVLKNHKKEGKWPDGLYCWHLPDKCPLIKNKDGSPDSGGKPAGGSLKFNAGLKYVLKTKMLMGDQEIEELLSQAEAQGN